MPHIRSIGLSVVALAMCAGSAIASPLNLTPQLPDVASGFIFVSYNAGSHVLTATGSTQNLTFPGMPPVMTNLNNRLFSLSMGINNDGSIDTNIASNFEVRGDYLGTNVLLYHSSNVAAFGFGATNRLEFIHLADGGSIVPLGSQIGTILSMSNVSYAGTVPSFMNSFTAGFNFGGQLFGTSSADSFIIPTPGAAALAGMGLVAFSRRRR
ncbi:MAG: MYXO-CTERM sorting domain-containing protein [Phycisphaerales bacterium]